MIIRVIKMQVAQIAKTRTVGLATLVMKVMVSLVLMYMSAITMTPCAIITPRAPIQNAVMNAAGFTENGIDCYDIDECTMGSD